MEIASIPLVPDVPVSFLPPRYGTTFLYSSINASSLYLFAWSLMCIGMILYSHVVVILLSSFPGST